MVDFRMNRRVLSWMLVITLLFSFSSAAYGSPSTVNPYTDVHGHWAEQQIQDWINKGWVKGYEDGSFKPNQTITRAEFVGLINRSFGLTEMMDIQSPDVDRKDWFYADVQKAMKAGYIHGYEDGTIRPNQPVSRQEAAFMIAQLLQLLPSQTEADVFKDASSIPEWSKGAVGALVSKNIMKGYKDNTYQPTKLITRAEAIATMDQALQVDAAVYNQPGTYGPSSGSTMIQGDVEISAAGVTLQNIVIQGNLTFAQGIGEGDATLKHVTVKGTATIRGGGEHSIHLIDSVLQQVVLNKDKGTVRIVAEGSTTVASLLVQSSAIIEELAVTSTGFHDIQLANSIAANAMVTLKGSFNTVDVLAKQLQIVVPSGVIQHMNVAPQASGLTLTMNKEAHLVSLLLEAAIKMLGSGQIDVVELSRAIKEVSTFEHQPGKLIIKGNVEGAPSSNSGGGSTSSGGGGPSGPTDQELANAVIAQIRALPVIASLTLNHEEAVLKANAAFTKLTKSQQALVPADDQTKLAAAVARIQELRTDQQAADKVIDQIKQLPALPDLTLKDETAVRAAELALNALTDTQKALIDISLQTKLNLVIAKMNSLIADWDKADAVITLITKLSPTDQLELADESDVVQAEQAFSQLSAVQKGLIPQADVDKLNQAIAQIAVMKEYKRVADLVTLRIQALPALNDLQLTDEAAVNAVQQAYDQLTDAQKIYVLAPERTKLTGALDKIAQLKETEAADKKAVANVTALIKGLPSLVTIKLNDEAEIQAANIAYQNLTLVQKKWILPEDKATLDVAVARIHLLKDDQAKADQVTQLIAALPTQEALKVTDEAQVVAAQNAFDVLTADQKALVSTEHQSKLSNVVSRMNELTKPMSIISKEITNFNYASVGETAAKADSNEITTTQFKEYPVEFTIRDGNISIDVKVNWNINVPEFTNGQIMGSVVDSTIQDYCNAHHIDLMNRPLFAVGSGNTFYISTTKTGSSAVIEISGKDANRMFNANRFTGTDNTSKNRTFTVSDGTHTTAIILNKQYTDMNALAVDINQQLQAASVAGTAQAKSATQFEITAASRTIQLTVDGTHKNEFFGS